MLLRLNQAMCQKQDFYAENLKKLFEPFQVWNFELILCRESNSDTFIINLSAPKLNLKKSLTNKQQALLSCDIYIYIFFFFLKCKNITRITLLHIHLFLLNSLLLHIYLQIYPEWGIIIHWKYPKLFPRLGVPKNIPGLYTID